MPLWLLATTQEPTPMRCLKQEHEDKYMVSSRKLTRREFCVNFPLLIPAALINSSYRISLPKRKFTIGDRVIGERLCEDIRSPNYGGIDWEKGFIVGYCWEYDDWLKNDLKQGWTYFKSFFNQSSYSQQ